MLHKRIQAICSIGFLPYPGGEDFITRYFCWDLGKTLLPTQPLPFDDSTLIAQLTKKWDINCLLDNSVIIIVSKPYGLLLKVLSNPVFYDLGDGHNSRCLTSIED